MKKNKKGIFCIEGMWDHYDIKDKSTVLPILDLLYKRGECDYIYHDCSTREELEFLLNKWQQKNVSVKYPILYLAFHGQEKNICLNSKDKYSIEEIAEFLEDKCFGKIIHFGSCSTLGTHGKRIQTFLKRTKAIATIGYKTEIKWLLSTACDLLIFEALQEDMFDNKGIRKIRKKIFEEYGKLAGQLGLRMEINSTLNIPRKQT